LIEQIFAEIDTAVTSRFRPNKTAAEGKSLAGEDADKTVLQPLVLTEQVADLAATDADITGRHVCILADVAVQFDHQGLTKPHDLAIALARHPFEYLGILDFWCTRTNGMTVSTNSRTA